jgi:hypothetical protein
MHLGQVMGEEGRHHQLQEYTRAGMEQPQEVGHGEAAPWPLHGRLAERLLKGRCIGHRAARAIDEERAMPMPPCVIQGGSVYGTAEAFEEEGKEA